MANRHAWEPCPRGARSGWRCKRCGVICQDKNRADGKPPVGGQRVHVARAPRPELAWRQLDDCDSELLRAVHES
jgi:hypothetical protein